MARVARAIDPERIRALKRQIDDSRYINAAIDRLAVRITERLLGLDQSGNQYYRPAKPANTSMAARRVVEE